MEHSVSTESADRVLKVGVGAGILRLAHAGIARYLVDMLGAMVRLDPGIRFYLYSSQAFDPELPPGNWVFRTGSRRSLLGEGYWLQRACPDAMARDGVDVFWGQNYMLPLKLRRPCARVVTLHDVTGVLYPGSMLLRRRINSRVNLGAALKAATRVVADSEATARLAHLCFGVQPDRVSVVYPGFTSRIQRPDGTRAAVAARRCVGFDGPFLLTVGTIEPRKNHDTLLDVLEADPGLPPLVIVGGRGWKCRETMARVQRLETLGRVRYLGRVEDAELGVLYAAACLMVYPSLYEGFGLPVLEAMTCGCPVVCSRTSSLPEVGGRAAAYFEPRDREELGRTLHLVLGDESLRGRMVTEGLRQAGSFSLDRAAREMSELLREAHRESLRDRAPELRELTARGSRIA